MQDPRMNLSDLYHSMDYGPAPESAQEAHRWLQSRNSRFGLFINGAWKHPKGRSSFETLNPASGEVLARCLEAEERDVDAAVQAAREALPGWQALSGHVRARMLYALAREMQKQARLLAVLETLDNGKTIRETRDIDVPLVIRHFYHHAGWAQLLESEFPEHEPVGVAGQIIPWNFPLLMLAWKVAPALAAGNTVVLKPAEFTPLTALWFAECCERIGLPPGVFNLLTGAGATGAALVRHPGVDKVAFTGSTEVGRQIREVTAGSSKKLTLELGGKSPFLVFDDADLDAAIEGVVDAIWFNQGQVCCAGSRLLVQENISDRFLEKLRRRMETLRTGDPLDKTMDLGAIVAPVQLERIQSLVEQGRREGATPWQASRPLPERGCFFPPTLISGVDPASTLAQVEIFGPVLVSSTFRTPDEAMELANNTAYGLAASVWSENINLALHLAPQLKAGVVWINSTNQFDASSGFGGYRESGFGREGGHEGMLEYLQPKVSSSGKAAQCQRSPAASGENPRPAEATVEINRTAKLFIGGKQVRPDSGYSLSIFTAGGKLAGEVGQGNRKDVRNAVEAAQKAKGWSSASAHNRAQVLYFLAENLSVRAAEFQNRLRQLTGCSARAATQEFEASTSRIFSYAAWADKYEGRVHTPPGRTVVLALHEPIGVVGVICPEEQPLLSLLSLLLPHMAVGNRVVLVPSLPHALLATDLYQVLETSDVPAGAVNLITGDSGSLLTTLADHDDVEGLWVCGTPEECAEAERRSAGNLKRLWTNHGHQVDWLDSKAAEGRLWLQRAVQVKNVWVPYGE